MLDELKRAARKAGNDHALRALMLDCRLLLSERGEANSIAIARGLVSRFRALPDDHQAGFFERLSRDFSPDPTAVLAVAQAYADEPGGTARIVAMRRRLLERLPRQPELARRRG